MSIFIKINIFRLTVKILRRFFNKTLCSKIYNTFKYLYYYIQDINTFSDKFESDDFIRILHNYLYGNFKKDWLGRIYGIVNPNLDKDGKYDQNRIIFEFDNETTHSNKFTETWIMKQLMLCKAMFRLEKLFDYISLDMKEVSPIGYDNYLLIFSYTSQKELFKSLKGTFWHALVYGIIAVILIIIL